MTFTGFRQDALALESTALPGRRPGRRFVKGLGMLKDILRNLTICFISIVMTLLGVEIVLRQTHLFGARLAYTQPDVLLGYRYTPNRQYWFFKENDHAITGKINRFGWRDKDWKEKADDGVYRIAVLGDSCVASFEVESDKTFLALTENKLNAGGPSKFELMNFGLQGAGQAEEFFVLQKDILKFNPNLVVLCFFPTNDIDDASRENSHSVRLFLDHEDPGKLPDADAMQNDVEFKLRSNINWIKQNSALVSLVCERYIAYKTEKRNRTMANAAPVTRGQGGYKDIDAINGYLTLCTSKPNDLYKAQYSLCKNIIRKMADTCRARNIDFMLVVMPDLLYDRELERRYRELDPGFDAFYFEKDLEDFSKAPGIHFLALKGPFSEYYQKHGRSLHWGHMNYEGHQVASESLAGSLLSILPN
jgi:hypothetical protein